jgi:glycosyltransferase involved in cell wall biosynthesis
MKYAGSQFRGHSENRSFVPAPSGSGQTTLRAPEKSPGGPLRILWVKVGGLWPVNTGGRLRSFHLISELSRDHQVTVLTTHHPEEGGDGLARHLPRCENVVSVPHAPVKRNSLQFLWALVRSWPTALPVDLHKSRIEKLAQRVQRELSSGKFDLCVADFLFAVPNMPAAGTTPIVFFAHNVEYMIWKRLCENGMGALRSGLLQIEWRKMRRYEHQACARADLTIAVSEEDQRLLRQGAPGSSIEAIPTGVDLDYFQVGDRSMEHPTEIVFSGSMDWHPNEDAVLYFIESILPLLRRKMPELSMTVVGRNPTRMLQKVARDSGVKVTGTVADVRPFVRRGAVYVVPLRIGGGTRLKIFEALAMGKAVVSTSIGAEGLPLEDGRHFLRADTPEAFAGRTLSLLADRGRRRELGDAGRRLLEQHYSWASVARAFERHCRSLVR